MLIKIYALCTSYYHLCQVAAFAGYLTREKSSHVHVKIFTEEFLGKSRIDPSSVNFGAIPASGDIDQKFARKGANMIAALHQAVYSSCYDKDENILMCADTFNLGFFSHLSEKKIYGRIIVFEDGSGAFLSSLQRARVKSRLDKKNITTYLLSELTRYALTKIAMQKSAGIFLIAERPFSRLGNINLAPNFLAILNNNFLNFDIPELPKGNILLFCSKYSREYDGNSNTRYLEPIKKAKALAKKTGSHLVIKPHPNEIVPIDLQQYVVDFDGPLELLIAKTYKSREIILVGFPSTALLTCKLLFGIQTFRISETSKIYSDPIYDIPELAF